MDGVRWPAQRGGDRTSPVSGDRRDDARRDRTLLRTHRTTRPVGMGVTRRARHRRLLEESDLRWQRTTWGYVVALESGEEIVASLQAFAEQRGIRAGAI